MSLLSVSDCRALVPTPLDDTQLQAIIDRVEAEITEAIGAPYEDASTTITETVRGGGLFLFVRRPIDSITTLTEYASLSDTTGTELTEHTHFYAWLDEGRIQRIGGSVRSAPSPHDVFYMSDADFLSGNVGGGWGPRVVIVYVPQDQREKRKQVIVDLVRIVLSQTALQSESIAGEYGYQAPPNWEAEKRRIMRRISFIEV